MPADNANLVLGLFLFTVAGIAMVLAPLLIGKFVRSTLSHPEKDVPYECGEPAIGSSWIQFDLRFYVVALVFVVFDIEIALFYPWAVIYRSAGVAALWDMLFFFGVIVVGYVYLWRFGYLDWVRSTASTSKPANHRAPSAGDDVSRTARAWT
ncbi:MAG: NADH-quinone oxidoreductase subunit A [Phycisphaerae bacterium]|nr:NADH-quinone oxidoreductase subunit A [Phycisphaerae bacterium]